MGDEILLIHANAGVGNGEGLALFVQFQINARAEWKALESILHKRQVAKLIESVGGV